MEDFKVSDVNDAPNEKGETTSIQADPNRNGTHARTTNREFDRARQYILDSSVTEADSSAVDLSVVRSKIDWKIVPIMFCCYMMQFVDKVLLNFAAVMGMPKQIKLVGNNLSNAASAFFIAYLIAEIPNAFILQKVSAPKWLGINVALWGVATACTAAAKDFHSLLAARIFLGIFEAAVAPSLTLISSQWYTKSEQAPRFGLWSCGVGVGQIVGGIVSYAFQQVKHQSIEGWQIMFIMLGVVTVFVGIGAFFIIPDTPLEAEFLLEAEKLALLNHVSVNRTGIQNKNYKLSQLVEMLLDPQLYLMVIITVMISMSSGVITTYSSTLIRNFGFTPPIAALLSTPSGLVSIASSLIVGYGIRHNSNRWAWIAVACIPGIIGSSLMSFLPFRNRAGLLAGIYMVNAITSTLMVIYQWTASNVAGHTKRSASVTLIAGSFSVGNIIGPQTFQAKDAPQYIPAKIIVLATQAGGALFAVILFLYYLWANKRKEAGCLGSVEGTVIAKNDEDGKWENLTDRQNKLFRYVY